MTQTLVRNHSHWGAFTAVVEDGRVVGVKPFEHDPDPSRLIEAIPDAVHSETRIARPMVREGWLEHGPGDGAGRGRQKFVPVPWERALDLVASELARVKREHGPQGIMGGSQGWSSAGLFHEARVQTRRFLAAFGGFVDQTSNYSFGTALTFLPHILGSPQAVTGPITSWSSIARHARLMVLFGGANPKNTQVAKGGCAYHAISGWIEELSRAGVDVVNISPIRDDGPGSKPPEWIAIRPNTDMALMLALTHTLVAEGRHDRAFLARYCTGFERVLPYLMGESDGQAKDAAWAERITAVPASTIVALARRMASERTMLTAAWSLQRADHGEQVYWALVLLAACLGQIGLPGGGVGFGYGSSANIAEPPLAFPGPAMDMLKNPAGLAIPAARITDCLLHPGERYDYDGASATYPDIRLVYWAGGNPFHHHQDLNRLRRAWERPETIIVHDPWWTATARHADIVLPATTSLERNDIGGAARDRFVMAMHKAIAPVGEARDDFAIFRDLAVRLGCEAQFTEGRDEAAWLRHMYATFKERAKSNLVPDFDAFWEKGWLEIPRRSDEYVLFEDFRADPEKHKLHTPSGRIELYSERIAGFGYDDCPPYPRWIEPSGVARCESGGGVSAASRLEPAALQAAQPDGLRAGRRARQGQRARGGGDQPRRRRVAWHRGRRRRANLQRARRLLRRRGRDGRCAARRDKAVVRRVVRPGERRRGGRLRSRQRQRADAGPRHLAPGPGAKLGHGARRGRALDRRGAGGARVRAARGSGVASPARLFRQIGLGIELRHVGRVLDEAHLDERVLQRLERRRIEIALGQEHRHDRVVFLVRDRGIVIVERARDRDGLGLVAAHEGDGVEPALDEAPHLVGMVVQRAVGGEDRVRQEVMDDLGRGKEHSSALRLLELEGERRRLHGGIDLAGLERRDVGRRGSRRPRQGSCRPRPNASPAIRRRISQAVNEPSVVTATFLPFRSSGPLAGEL